MSKNENMATEVEVQQSLDTVLKPYIEYRERAGLDSGDDNHVDGDDDDEHDRHDGYNHDDNDIDDKNNDNRDHVYNNHDKYRHNDDDNWQEQTIDRSGDEL